MHVVRVEGAELRPKRWQKRPKSTQRDQKRRTYKTWTSDTVPAQNRSQDISKECYNYQNRPISTQKIWIYQKRPVSQIPPPPKIGHQTCHKRPVTTKIDQYLPKRSESTKKDTIPAQNRSEDMSKETSIYDTFYWQFPLKTLHPRHSPNWETQIPRFLAVQLHIGILVQFEFVRMNLSFSIRWISGGVVFLVETVIPTETFIYPKRSVSVERDLHVRYHPYPQSARGQSIHMHLTHASFLIFFFPLRFVCRVRIRDANVVLHMSWHSNSSVQIQIEPKIPIWLCTARFQGIWVSRFGGCRASVVYACEMHMFFFFSIQMHMTRDTYGVATISRLLKMVGFFCRISSLL